MDLGSKFNFIYSFIHSSNKAVLNVCYMLLTVKSNSRDMTKNKMKFLLMLLL